jgi:hypothetical protein
MSYDQMKESIFAELNQEPDETIIDKDLLISFYKCKQRV